jgi:hypothetical protein
MQSSLFSQENFKKIIVINNEGDSIHGFIKDLGWLRNPETFTVYHSLESDEKNIMSTENTKGVIIEGRDMYKRYNVTMSMDERLETLMNIGIDSTKITKTVFLSVLVEGCNVNLYSYTDEIKTRYFFTDQNTTTPKELIYKVFLTNEHQDIKNQRTYLGQLAYLANYYSPGSKDLKNKIRNAPYLAIKLIEIFTLINGGNNSVCLLKTSSNKTKLNPYVSFGLRRTTLGYMSHVDLPAITSASIKEPSYFPYLGIGLKISNSSGSRLFFREEVGFSMDKPISKDQYSEPLNYLTEDYNYRISQYNFTLSNLVVYNLIITSNLKWNLGSGVNLNFSRVFKSEYNSVVHSFASENSYKIEKLLDARRIWFTFPIKIGINMKEKFDFNACYYIPYLQTNNSKIKSFEVGIIYYFKK